MFGSKEYTQNCFCSTKSRQPSVTVQRLAKRLDTSLVDVISNGAKGICGASEINERKCRKTLSKNGKGRSGHCSRRQHI